MFFFSLFSLCRLEQAPRHIATCHTPSTLINGGFDGSILALTKGMNTLGTQQWITTWQPLSARYSARSFMLSAFGLLSGSKFDIRVAEAPQSSLLATRSNAVQTQQYWVV